MIIDFQTYIKTKKNQQLQSSFLQDDTPSGHNDQDSSSEGTLVAYLPNSTHLTPQTTRTVADLLTRYRQEYLPLKAETTQYQLHGIYNRIERDLGRVPLTELTPDRLRHWRDKLAKHYAPGTVRRYMDMLSGPITVAIRDLEWMEVNPLRKVVKPPEPPGRVRCLSPDERDRLLAACQRSRQKLLYLVTALALATGARKTELLSLRWSYLDLERGMLRFARTKNGERRSVPVTGLALKLLQAHAEQRAKSGLVFPGRNGTQPLNADYPFRIAVKRAGIEDFHFHDLRHTFASYLAMSGATTTEIAELMGHRTMQMVKKYVHFGGGHLIAVAAKMTREFLPE